MAKQVYIESLKLANFGPFYGENNEITFETRSRRGANVLIGGKNGAGKTHILRALYLGIVGSAGVGDLRSVEADSGATRFNFDHLLNRRAEREGISTCSVSVRIVERDADTESERALTFIREITFRANSRPIWKSTARRSDGSPDVTDEETIEQLRDAYLPRHLARFFFFDAEKSQNFQLGEEDIVKGISRILGLWAYEELEERLRTLIQNATAELNDPTASSATAKLGEINGKIVAIDAKLQDLDDQRQALSVLLKEAEATLADREDQLKTIGAIDPVKHADSVAKREETKTAKGKLEGKVGDAWELALPIDLLGGLRLKILEQLAAEKRKRAWEDRKAAVSPKLPGIKAQVFDGALPEHALSEPTLDYYTARLDRALKSLFDPPPEGVEGVTIHLTETAEAATALENLLARGAADLSELAEASRQLERLQEYLLRLDHEVRQQNQNLAALGAGKELHQARAELTVRIDGLKKKLDDIAAQRVQAEADLNELRGEETRWQENARKAKAGRTLVERASAYREAAHELRERAALQMRIKINDLVGDLWLDIMGRRHEFVAMKFNRNWECHLVRKNESEVNWNDVNTSAGQRQVRLLAFYEALRRLAYSVPPLVVDTPLGRLDKEVREAVLNKLYLSNEGHQSIVLSTNAEIDPETELFEKMRRRFGRAYTLVPYGSPDSDDYAVEIKEGYFGHEV
jgi:DNA sulfur modification protein DndD